tara:strand:+ start:1740 stop:4292 length:2553 start_codon:yes stop_codon:yes gene_type:complete
MSKKIVITGGLGYIGTELCKIYSGESWRNQITVIDNNFASERVNQLRNWSINFVQADIRDSKNVKNFLKDADIIHHLAGITDVARTKEESNLDRDKELNDVAKKGTSVVLSESSENCKIIFPSTHVVFEGKRDRDMEKDIEEDCEKSPVLSYAIGKDKNEEQIKESKKNYIILRLASVYGYSTDAMRLDIMPNLFSKISSQDGIIKLFAGGKQLKSLVPLVDVARCFKFMEERDDIKFQTFNLSKDKVTVEQVADICKKVNSKIKIIKTEDKIPNLGYVLSNKKLLNKGFKFLYGLEESIQEMISKWSRQNIIKNLEHVKKGEKEFVDHRGKISNYELPEPINLVGYIDSKKGTVRANHFHPIQEQKCLLVKGQFISIYKDLLNKNSQKITHVVNEGDLIVTKPNVAHAMVFTKDSIFLNLIRGEREHENYGVTHTKKYILVKEEEKDLLMKNYKFHCRSCGKTNLKRVVSLGYQPLANNLLNKKDSKCELYPLEMNYCNDCHNCQLSVVVDPKTMFSNYLYLSSTSKSFRKHFEDAAGKYIKEFKLSPKKSYVIDIGSNDGVALKPFKDLGFKKILGIESAKNLAKLANKNKIKTINCFLENKNLRKIKKNADIILASNVFAHSDKLKEMAECMLRLLRNNGTIIIEVQYLLNTLKDLTFDNIYHEHYNYWSLTSLVAFFNRFKAKIYKAEKINTHGGSLRIYIKKNLKIKTEKSVKSLLIEEEKFGIKKYQTYLNFAKKVYEIRDNVKKNILKLKKNNTKIIGYGSPAKATTALNFFGISKEIDCIVEDNKLKHGKFLPGVKIPIVSKSFVKNKPDYALVLAWNFINEIERKNIDLAHKFISIKDLEN